MLSRLITTVLATFAGMLSVADDCELLDAKVGRARRARGAVTTQLRADSVERHEFFGRHLLANYMDCDMAALCNLSLLRQTIQHAVHASGATICGWAEHVFPPNGLTLVLLLSESHASIHTYPEHAACFVDLFTCGRTCEAERFDQVMRDYLRPGRVCGQIMLREHDIYVDPSGAR